MPAISKMLNQLVILGKRKFIRQLCYELIIQIAKDVTSDILYAELLPLLFPIIEDKVQDYNPDQLALAIALRTVLADKKERGEKPPLADAAGSVPKVLSSKIPLVASGKLQRLVQPLQVKVSVIRTNIHTTRTQHAHTRVCAKCVCEVRACATTHTQREREKERER